MILLTKTYLHCTGWILNSDVDMQLSLFLNSDIKHSLKPNIMSMFYHCSVLLSWHCKCGTVQSGCGLSTCT